MCGFLYQSEVVLEAQEEELKHRGPDFFGVSRIENMEFAHWRLSILGVDSRYNQPMEREGAVIVYNGEIFNFKELGEKYYQKVFENDTELLIALLNRFGEKVIPEIKGMYAFVYRDKLGRTLIARDRLGIKPLYYSIVKGQIILSSEINPIKRRVNTDINKSALLEFLVHGVVHSDTVFNEIKEFPASSYGYFHNGELKIIKHSDIIFEKRLADENLDTLLQETVSRHLQSDVPIGVLLSSGIDSSLISYYASKTKSGLKYLTMDFGRDTDNSEVELASKFCKEMKLSHEVVRIKDFNIDEIVVELLQKHGQPFGDAADVALYMLYSSLPENIKVVIQGDGGDEMFGGYRRHRLIRLASLRGFFKLIPSTILTNKIKRHISILLAEDYRRHSLLLRLDEDSILKIQSFLNSHEDALILKESIDKPYFEVYQGLKDKGLSLLQKLYVCDIHLILKNQFLKKVDIASMAKSKEARVPLLYDSVINYMLGSDVRKFSNLFRGKLNLRKISYKVLPNYISGQKKKGFGVPYSIWLNTVLKEDYMATLQNLEDIGLFNAENIKNDFLLGKSRPEVHWRFFILAKWLKIMKAEDVKVA